ATTAGVNFADDNIDKVHVFLRYDEIDEGNPARPRVAAATDGILATEKDSLDCFSEKTVRVDMARNAQGGHKEQYQFRTEVFYKNAPKSQSDWAPATDRYLLLTPRAMGALRLELALTAAKAVVDSARVALRYAATTGTIFTNEVELTPDAARRTWFQPTGELA